MLSEIVTRRSIRRYLSRPVPKEALEQILQAGALAPSSKNRQPWRFQAALGDGKAEALNAMRRGLAEEARRPLLPESAEYLPGALRTLSIMEQAPAIVFVTNPFGKDPRAALTVDERVSELCSAQSLGACMENMTLQSESMGLGSLWICDIYFAYDALMEWLGEPGSLMAAAAFGYAAEQPPPRPRRTLAELVKWRE